MGHFRIDVIASLKQKITHLEIYFGCVYRNYTHTKYTIFLAKYPLFYLPNIIWQILLSDPRKRSWVFFNYLITLFVRTVTWDHVEALYSLGSGKYQILFWLVWTGFQWQGSNSQGHFRTPPHWCNFWYQLHTSKGYAEMIVSPFVSCITQDKEPYPLAFASCYTIH